MCVDDVVCTGAEPLAFLDYVAVGRARSGRRRRAGERRGGRLPRGGLRARRRRDRRAPGADGRRRVRPGRGRDRGRRALADDRRVGRPSRRRDRRAGVVGPALERLLAGPRADDRVGARAWPSRTRPACAGRSATRRPTRCCARAPNEAMATLGETLLTPTRIYARALLRRPRDASSAEAGTFAVSPTSRAAGCPATCRAPCRTDLGARVDPARWAMPSVMRLVGALGGMDDDEVRATFNGGIGMIAVVPPDAVAATIAGFAGHDIEAALDRRGRGGRDTRAAPATSRGRSRVSRDRPDRGRCLGRRLEPAGARGGRRSPASSAARSSSSSPTVPARRSTGRRSRGSRPPSSRVATTRRWPLTLVAARTGRRRARRLHADHRAEGARAFRRTDPQHPPVAAARLPGRARRRATRWPTASAVTGCTVHLVDETLDGGPIVAQEAVADPAGRRRGDAARADPRGRAPAPAAGRGAAAGRRACRRTGRSARPGRPRPRGRRRAAAAARAAVGLRQDAGWSPFAGGLVRAGFELVSTGGTARALRDAGLPVTDVAAVTGFPEMLDGRVKTLHPRVHGGILADRRLADHRRQLLAAAIAPFELVVVNLYPFAAAAERPGITFDELVEEIDIGGPSMVRAAAKNHANVAIVTSPARYDAVLAAIEARRARRRRAPRRAGRRSVPAHRRVRRPDRRGPADPPAGGAGAARRARAARGDGSVSAEPDDRAREGRVAALRGEPPPAGGPLPAPGERPGRRPVRDRRSARSRARPCPTTTSWTRRPWTRSAVSCAARPW